MDNAGIAADLIARLASLTESVVCNLQKQQATERLAEALHMVLTEYWRATAKNAPFNSAHEGYAVMLEEFDELWDEVKKRTPDPDGELLEAVQTTAMGLRYIVDICLGKRRESAGCVQDGGA